MFAHCFDVLYLQIEIWNAFDVQQHETMLNKIRVLFGLQKFIVLEILLLLLFQS